MKLGQGNIFIGVCLSTEGRVVCLSACWDIPPRADTPRSRHPPGSRADPPDQTLPRDQPPRTRSPRADTPLGADTPPDQIPPPGTRTPPPPPPAVKQTPAYGQRAVGTHPTGMHSCTIKNYRNKISYCHLMNTTYPEINDANF